MSEARPARRGRPTCRQEQHVAAVDGRHCDGLAIAQQIKPAREIVSPLVIGDDAFSAFLLPAARCTVARDLDKAF